MTAASMHAVVVRHADRTHTTQCDTTMVIQRTLGARTLRITMSESQRFEEALDGTISAFRFDRDENGVSTSAEGKVHGGSVVATIHRLGRVREQRVAMPAGLELVGQKASQDRLAKAPSTIGDTLTFGTVVLLGHDVVVTRSLATLTEQRDNGDRLYRMVMEAAPFPMTMLIDAQAELKGMTMDIAVFKLVLKPSDGPVALLGAELAATGLVSAAGPAPRAGPRNRYRVDRLALAALPDDAFQSVDGDVVTVSSAAPASALSDPAPLLASETQLETDDPGLRAWVAEVLAEGGTEMGERAERLRLAVRSRIENKDLDKIDGSALEAFRERRGDCTEHANLLCAALRIAGIPARTDIGVVFAAEYRGWVGHAWNSAWWDGAWHHLDSAYPGIARSCYLRLGSSSGGTGTAMAMAGAMTAFAGKSIETLAE